VNLFGSSDSNAEANHIQPESPQHLHAQDIGASDGHRLLWMECWKGETLAKRLDKVRSPWISVKFAGGAPYRLMPSTKLNRSGIVHARPQPGTHAYAHSLEVAGFVSIAKPGVALATAANTDGCGSSQPVTEPGTIIGNISQLMFAGAVEGKRSRWP